MPSTSIRGVSSTVLPSMASTASAMDWISSGVSSWGTLMKNVCSSVVPLSRYRISDLSRSSLNPFSFSSSADASSPSLLLKVAAMSM